MISATKDATIYASGVYPYTLTAEFTETETSEENNTSTLSCTAKLKSINNFWSTSYPSSIAIYWHDNRQNEDVLVKAEGFEGMTAGETKTATGTITVYHKDDGTLSGYAYAYFTKGTTTSTFAPESGGVATDLTALTSIDRYPLILTAPNFTDEDNPTITYSTAIGFEGATVETAIFDSTGNTNYVPYRSVIVANGSYTFNLTAEERNTLRNATPNSNELDVLFKLRTTTTNNEIYFSYSSKKLSIINANPTYTHSEEETNAKVITVLGSSANSIVQNASIMKVTIVPTALKGATISSVRVRSGSTYVETKTSSPYVFNIPVTTSSFTLTVTDSRGNTSSTAVQKTLLSYLPVDISSFTFKRESPVSSDIILNFEGQYYQATYSGSANAPIVSWKLDEGSYTTIPNTNYSIDTANNKLTITDYELTNALAYNLQGQFYIKIEDLFTETQDGGANGLVLKGIPTYDVGEHDVQINGDLYIADTDGDNPTLVSVPKILWENQNPGNTFSGQTIALLSDDYDMLAWVFKRSYDQDILSSTMFIIKGYGGVSITILGDGTTRRRGFTYYDDTHYTIGDGSMDDGTTDNEVLIPLYVIGYKTGLF